MADASCPNTSRVKRRSSNASKTSEVGPPLTSVKWSHGKRSPAVGARLGMPGASATAGWPVVDAGLRQRAERQACVRGSSVIAKAAMLRDDAGAQHAGEPLSETISWKARSVVFSSRLATGMRSCS